MENYTSRLSTTEKFLFIIPAFFFFSCGEPAQKQQNDTASSSNAMVNAVTKHNISISSVKAPVPKNVSDSIFNGPYIEKYSNGVIFKRGDIAGGEANGQWLTFYDDGKPWSEGIYKNGLRQGHGISWWHNGQKSSEGDYKDGNMIGLWKFWDEEGHEADKDYGDGGK